MRAVLLSMALCLTGCGDPPPSDRGEPAITTSPATPVLSDDAGRSCTPLADDGRKATVLLFLMRDCPVANATAPEISRLAAEFIPKGIRFFAVYATETPAEIKAHRAEYALPLPGLQDPGCQLALFTGATRVPEAAVLSPGGQLLYRGRIDDRAVKPGVTRPEPTRHDLRLALESVLAGKPPEPKLTTAVGCYLPVP